MPRVECARLSCKESVSEFWGGAFCSTACQDAVTCSRGGCRNISRGNRDGGYCSQTCEDWTICSNKGCRNPSLDGLKESYCSESCQQHVKPRPFCALITCTHASRDGREGSFCSARCEEFATCSRPGCRQLSKQMSGGGYCSQTCEDWTLCSRPGCRNSSRTGLKGSFCSQACEESPSVPITSGPPLFASGYSEAPLGPSASLPSAFPSSLGGSCAAVSDSDMCIVCMDLQADSAVVPCGHMCGCFSCLTQIFTSSSPFCPICRGDVTSVIRICPH